MAARRALRALSVAPGAAPTAQQVYDLVLEATDSEPMATQARSARLDAELRAGETPQV